MTNKNGVFRDSIQSPDAADRTARGGHRHAGCAGATPAIGRVPGPGPRVTTLSRGFTLLEVVAAIAILALSAAVLMQALGASMALTHKAAARTHAAAWAQSLLDTAFVMRPPVPGVTQGRFDERYRWRLTVTPWQSPNARSTRQAQPAAPMLGERSQLYKLDLAVMWGPPDRQHVAHFDTLRVVRADATRGVP